MDETEGQRKPFDSSPRGIKIFGDATMFKHSLNEPVRLKTYVDWFLLAFLAGCVNAGGFMACERFVTHVTGFATLAGVDFARGQFAAAIGILTVPAYFLGGVMVSAYFIDRRIQEGKKPHYALVMSLVSACLFLAALGGVFGLFSEFGTEVQLRRDYFFLALLCAASGLQNAALTTSSGATIRTTHLTGITTDLGIGLMRASALPARDERKSAEKKANWLRLGTISAYMVGSCAGAVVFLAYRYLGFALPGAIALYATLVALGGASGDPGATS